MPNIVAIGTSVPDFVATNDYVTSLVIEHSTRIYKGDIAELEHNITAFLDNVGAKRRRWRAGSTKPIEHISDAWLNCLSRLENGCSKRIGALIYCGIDKGIVEPSHASFMAKKFGLLGIRTLDVSDACMGWFTATQIASRFVSPEHPYCAIISAEFPIELPGKVHPASFTIRDDEDFLWKGAALTLGECASVTIINPIESQPEDNVFKSRNQHADLCCVPLERPDRFIDSARLGKRLLDNCFVADMAAMASAGYRDSRDALKEYISLYGQPDIVLPHTVSQKLPYHISSNIIDESSLKNCFETFGNISTCSIPVGYEFFGGFNKNQHVAGWIAAAGMSHSVFRIVGS